MRDEDEGSGVSDYEDDDYDIVDAEVKKVEERKQ